MWAKRALVQYRTPQSVYHVELDEAQVQRDHAPPRQNTFSEDFYDFSKKLPLYAVPESGFLLLINQSYAKKKELKATER